MDRQRAAAIFDKAELPELIHEMTDPRPGGADHLRQVFLIDSGEYSFGFSFLTKMGQQQENPGQALLAGVEKLVDEILMISHVAGKQMRDEQFRDAVLFVEHAHHQQLFDLVKSTIGQRASRGHAQRPTGEASLAEELTGAQNGDDRFLALLGCDRVFHLALLDIPHGIRGVSLHIDRAVRAVF